MGPIVPLYATPESLAGRCSRIVANPWGSRFTCDALMKASVVSLSTQVLLVFTRRAIQRWFRSVRPLMLLANIPGVFNSASSHGPLQLYLLPPYHASAPFNDPKLVASPQDHGHLRNLRKILPAGRFETHLRQPRVIIERVSLLPRDASFTLLRVRLAAAAISETAGCKAALGSAPSSRGFAQGIFCLCLVRRVVAAWGSGSGGEPACPGGVKDPAAAGSQGVNTGRNKLLSAASALGIQVLDREAMPLAREPVTRYQWLILKAALEPKANGDPIKYSYLL